MSYTIRVHNDIPRGDDDQILVPAHPFAADTSVIVHWYVSEDRVTPRDDWNQTTLTLEQVADIARNEWTMSAEGGLVISNVVLALTPEQVAPWCATLGVDVPQGENALYIRRLEFAGMDYEWVPCGFVHSRRVDAITVDPLEEQVRAIRAAGRLGFVAPSDEWMDGSEPLNVALQYAAHRLRDAGELPEFD